MFLLYERVVRDFPITDGAQAQESVPIIAGWKLAAAEAEGVG